MKIVWAIVAAILAAVVGRAVMQRSNAGSDDPRSRHYLQRIADNTNRQLPLQVDDDVEFTRMMAGDGVVSFTYRLVNHRKNELSLVGIDMLKNQVTQQACEHPIGRDSLFARGISVRIHFVDRDRANVLNFLVRPERCGA